MQTNRWNV